MSFPNETPEAIKERAGMMVDDDPEPTSTQVYATARRELRIGPLKKFLRELDPSEGEERFPNERFLLGQRLAELEPDLDDDPDDDRRLFARLALRTMDVRVLRGVLAFLLLENGYWTSVTNMADARTEARRNSEAAG